MSETQREYQPQVEAFLRGLQEGVEPAEAAGHLSKGAFSLAFVRNVGGQIERRGCASLAAEAGGFRQGVGRARQQGQGRTLACQAQCNGAADAPAGPRDQGHLPLHPTTAGRHVRLA